LSRLCALVAQRACCDKSAHKQDGDHNHSFHTLSPFSGWNLVPLCEAKFDLETGHDWALFFAPP
jgi:hypothetical protein